MRILADGRAHVDTLHRGIRRYADELLPRLARQAEVDLWCATPHLPPLPEGVVLRGNPLTRPARWNTPKRLLGRLLTARLSPPTGYDVYHSIAVEPSPNPDLPMVATVHDMIPERLHAGTSAAADRIIAHHKAVYEAADRLIAISHATAAELASIYPHLADRTHVIYHGAEHLRADAAGTGPLRGRALDIQGPYVLFVGRRESYKNFATLIKAMQSAAWDKSVKAVAVGPEPTAVESARYATPLNRGELIFAVDVSNAALQRLLAGAGAMVFPSEMEGFGFPIIEAQSMATPVVCSDTPIFREIGGDGALYFPPKDPDALADRVNQALDPATRTRLENDGTTNLRRFSWDRCADQTLAVYQQLAG